MSSETGISATAPASLPSLPTTLATMTTTTRRTTSTRTSYTWLRSVTSTTTGCSSNIYRDAEGGFTAFDPNFYTSYVGSEKSCQPSAVITWYNQPVSTYPTALGSSSGTYFTCPYAYTTVTVSEPTPTATANTTTTTVSRPWLFAADDIPKLVQCCPSGYSYNASATISDYRPGYFASQCYSVVAASESLRYWTRDAGVITTANTIVPADATLTVYGIPVNGFVGTRTSATSLATSTSSSSSSTSSSTRANLPLILGLTFGLGFAVLLFCVCVNRKQSQRNRLAGSRAGSRAGSINVNEINTEAARPLQPSQFLAQQRIEHARYGARDSHEDEAPPPYTAPAPPYKP